MRELTCFLLSVYVKNLLENTVTSQRNSLNFLFDFSTERFMKNTQSGFVCKIVRSHTFKGSFKAYFLALGKRNTARLYVGAVVE